MKGPAIMERLETCTYQGTALLLVLSLFGATEDTALLFGALSKLGILLA